jgi:CrcB protein
MIPPDMSGINLGAAMAWSAAGAVGLGAALGALLRWQLGAWLNSLWPAVPAGTLAANVLGGYGIGLAMAFFAQRPELPPEWRLLVITGFLGGLTTFSAFSAEVMTLLQQGRWAAGAGAAALHLAGSLLATAAGLATLGALKPATGAA